MFTPRLTKPEKNNKYYITKENSGYSTCIKGKPQDSDCDVLSNCVGYATGRFNEIIGEWKYAIKGNAGDWFKNAQSLGLQTGQKPKLGAIAVWSAHNNAGHVAIVEEMGSDTVIVTSESGWLNKAFWTQKRLKGNGNWGQGTNYKFLGFIYNPVVKDIPIGVNELCIKIDGYDRWVWAIEIAGENYIRAKDLETAGAVSKVEWKNNQVQIKNR